MIFTCSHCETPKKISKPLMWQVYLTGGEIAECKKCRLMRFFKADADIHVKSYRVKTYAEFLEVNGLKPKP